jgi:broad specificity phosphatase PhoE
MKRLVLIRHAHRSTEDRTRDNGLSEKGHEQTKRLVKFARERLESDSDSFGKIEFLSSPKKRCRETLGPVADAIKSKVTIEPLLDEHHPGETASLFTSRVQEFLEKWKAQGSDLSVLCSHGDWIPLAVQLLTGAKIGLKKAAWCEIEYTGGECFITWLVQKP